MSVFKRFLAIVLMLVLCSPGYGSWRVNVNPWRERRQDDVASVLVAVQSVAPFEDYVESLQPDFQMNEEKALEAAVAQIRTQDTQESQTLRASLALRLPEITRSTDSTETREDGTTTSKSTTTRSSKPGALSDAATPDALARAVAAAALPSTETSLDPSMKFTAATTLMQRVALLNNYVRDAAVRLRTKPYLVRLLVTVLPSAATRGYDAYTTVSFFTTDKYANGQPIPSSDLLRSASYGPKNKEDFITDCANKPLDVIPLLVTDTIVSSLNSDNLERARDLALAVQGIASNTRFGGGIRSQRDRIDKTLARSFNGLMTVSRVAQNSIEVRLGAMAGNREDALVPRTYDVTALVLFPIGTDKHGAASEDVLPCSMASYSAQTTFRNSQNGKAARPASLASLREKVGDFVANEGLHADEPKLNELIRDAQTGDYPKFVTHLSDPDLAPLLWPRVVAVVGRHSFSRGFFQVAPRDVEFFSTSASGSLFDDGKKATLTLLGARSILSDRVLGTIKVKGKRDDKATEETIVFPAKNVEVSNDGREAVLTFDSIHRYLTIVSDISAEVAYAPGARDWEQSRSYPVWRAQQTPIPNYALLTYVAPEIKPKADPRDTRFDLRVGTKTILTDDGLGSMTIALKRTDKKLHPDLPMFIAIEGADVRSSGGLGRIGSDFASKDDGLWTFDLANLTPGKIVVHAWSGEDKDRIDEPDVTIDVQPQQSVYVDRIALKR